MFCKLYLSIKVENDNHTNWQGHTGPTHTFDKITYMMSFNKMINLQSPISHSYIFDNQHIDMCAVFVNQC